MQSPLRREKAALNSPVRSLDSCNVDLLHLQHGSHGTLGFIGVGVADHFVHGRWNDLPGHAVFVLQPAAGAFFTPFAEPLPEVVYVFLRPAIDDQRQGFVELEICWTPLRAVNCWPSSSKSTIMTVPA